MKQYYSIFCLFFMISLTAKQVSIIVPCHFKHAVHLNNLLRIYERQTLLPDEVVISLSNAGSVQHIINNIAAQKWLFPVKVVTSSHRLTAGQNRNKACQNASGDIFICQDADDIPHPQRVEIIHYFFEKYNLDHLQHQWAENQSWVLVKNLDQIPFMHIDDHSKCYGKGYVQGAPALSKELFAKVQWGNEPAGEDTHFNGRVYAVTKNTLLIPLVLYQYRRNLKSSRNIRMPTLFTPEIIDDNN